MHRLDGRPRPLIEQDCNVIGRRLGVRGAEINESIAVTFTVHDDMEWVRFVSIPTEIDHEPVRQLDLQDVARPVTMIRIPEQPASQDGAGWQIKCK